MTLYTYEPGIMPLGQFDVLDSYMSSIKGGEVGTIFGASRANTASEKSAYDVKDGYDYNLQRVAVANRINANTVRPIWLLDEGTTGYGTLFGQVIGSPTGLSTTGTNLGPHTAAGSGKVTCWDKPGIYAISADAVDTSGDGLVITNSECVPGLAIKPQADGVLTANSAGTAVNVVVARFVEFETSPFLVTTPPSLIGATESVVRVIISYHVA